MVERFLITTEVQILFGFPVFLSARQGDYLAWGVQCHWHRNAATPQHVSRHKARNRINS